MCTANERWFMRYWLVSAEMFTSLVCFQIMTEIQNEAWEIGNCGGKEKYFLLLPIWVKRRRSTLFSWTNDTEAVREERQRASSRQICKGANKRANHTPKRQTDLLWTFREKLIFKHLPSQIGDKPVEARNVVTWKPWHLWHWASLLASSHTRPPSLWWWRAGLWGSSTESYNCSSSPILLGESFCCFWMKLK